MAKLDVCRKFCSMLGLWKKENCAPVCRAVLALSMCCFETDDVRNCLAYALVNLNKNWQYVASLSGSARADVAVFHIYIAQSNLADAYVPCKLYCETCFVASYTWNSFFEHILQVMKLWDNRVIVTATECDAAMQIFDQEVCNSLPISTSY